MKICLQKKEWGLKIGIGCILFMITFVFLMQSPLNILLPNGNSATDSSVFKTIALCMEKGLMPYRDVFDHKGPLIYIYNWLGMKIAYWRGIWAIEFISLFVCFVYIYKAAGIVCTRFFSVVVVLICSASLYSYFEWGNLTEEYALPFIVGSLYYFMDYFLNDYISKPRLIMCGGFLGAVCMLRINMISIWLVFCIAVLIQCVHKKIIKNVYEFLWYFLIGFFAIIIPPLFWIIIHGAFKDFLEQYFVFNVQYIDVSLLAQYNTFSVFINDFYIILAILVSVYMCKDHTLFHMAYVAYIFLTLVSVCISGNEYKHYGMILVPVLIYPISMLLSKKVIKEKHWILAFMLCMVITYTIPSWISGLNKMAEYCFQEEKTKTRSDTTGKIVQYVVTNSDENDKIIVWGN